MANEKVEVAGTTSIQDEPKAELPSVRKPAIPLDLEYFDVQQVISKKKKLKGKLGVGGDTVYWACQVGKVPFLIFTGRFR